MNTLPAVLITIDHFWHIITSFSTNGALLHASILLKSCVNCAGMFDRNLTQHSL